MDEDESIMHRDLMEIDESTVDIDFMEVDDSIMDIEEMIYDSDVDYENSFHPVNTNQTRTEKGLRQKSETKTRICRVNRPSKTWRQNVITHRLQALYFANL